MALNGVYFLLASTRITKTVLVKLDCLDSDPPSRRSHLRS